MDRCDSSWLRSWEYNQKLSQSGQGLWKSIYLVDFVLFSIDIQHGVFIYQYKSLVLLHVSCANKLDVP